MFNIRHSTKEDIEIMQTIFSEAKEKMRKSGNIKQWTDEYPSNQQLLLDIHNHSSYVVESQGNIVATFVLAFGNDPTYSKIYNGQWLDNTLPYATIHRIASRHGVSGIMEAVLSWAENIITNIRIDTHRDNSPMQHLLNKHGFSYCGIILLANGDERLAYQRIREI